MGTIVDWLQQDGEPADLYELLGEARFEPSRQRLLAAARSRYRDLLPYEGHQDPKIAGRATALIRRLAGVDATLRDPKKLRAHLQAIFENLRAAYACDGGERFTEAELADWLRRQSIHPQQIGVVARMLAPPRDETQSFSLAATRRYDAPGEGEPSEDFYLEELEPSREELQQLPPLEAVRGAGRAAEPIVAEVVTPGFERHATNEEEVGLPCPGKPHPLGRRRTRRAKPQLGWVALACAVGAFLLFTVVLVLSTGSGEAWQGVLLEVRGQGDETHLLLQLSGASQVEAVTRDPRIARVLDDCWSVEELREVRSADSSARQTEAGAGASEVLIRGRRGSTRAATFRLVSRADVPLVEVEAIERPRARRDSARNRPPPGRLTELAQLLRIHPPAGTTVSFPARYGGSQSQRVTVFPGVADRRPVVLDFPGTSPSDFADYRVEDAVVVRAIVQPQTSVTRFVLRGVEIHRLGEPPARVTARASGG